MSGHQDESISHPKVISTARPFGIGVDVQSAHRGEEKKKVACLMMAWRHGSMTPRCGYAFNAVWQFDKSRLIFRHSTERFWLGGGQRANEKWRPSGVWTASAMPTSLRPFSSHFDSSCWFYLLCAFVDDRPWRFYLSVYVCVISSVFLVDQICLLTLNYMCPVSSSLDTFYTPVELARTERLRHSV